MLRRTTVNRPRTEVRYHTDRFPCAICSIESQQHAGWFLAVENSWLDRLKILSWHPVLASQAEMRSVCGRQHLKVLLMHWLNQANLRFQARPAALLPTRSEADNARPDAKPVCAGRLVGELAVHRESLSRVWTGSPETLECILNALIGGLADRTCTSGLPPLEVAPDYAGNYAFSD